MAVLYQNKMAEALAGIDASAKKAMTKACYAARSQILKNLSGTRTGIVYKVPGTNREYTASAPGEYPAIRLGDLRQRVTLALATEGGALVGIVGTPLLYGAYLEDPKKTRGRDAREWLGPSLVQARSAIMAALGDPWHIEQQQQESGFDKGTIEGDAEWGE